MRAEGRGGKGRAAMMSNKAVSLAGRRDVLGPGQLKVNKPPARPILSQPTGGPPAGGRSSRPPVAPPVWRASFRSTGTRFTAKMRHLIDPSRYREIGRAHV